MPALSDYRWALLEELGGGGVYTTTGNGSTNTIICSTAFKSTALPTSHLAYAWAYVAAVSAPKQRRIRADGLTPGTGTVTLDDVLGSATLSGQVFEVSRFLPLIDDGAKTPGVSLNQCLNNALRDIECEDTIQLQTVAGERSITLATYSVWLNRPSRLVDILDPPVAAGYPPQSAAWRGMRLVIDGPTPRLEFETPYLATGDIVTLRVIRPSDTLISGAETTHGRGMLTDAATALPEVKDLVTVAMIYARRAQAMLSDSDEEQIHYRTLAAEQEQKARAEVRGYKPRGAPAPVQEAA